jgi:hypothetical protein
MLKLSVGRFFIPLTLTFQGKYGRIFPICSSNNQVNMNNRLLVTRAFVEKEDPVEIYRSAKNGWKGDLGCGIFLLAILWLMVFAAIAQMPQPLQGRIFSGLALFSLAACLVLVYGSPKPSAKRLKVIRSSIFGETLDELYQLCEQVSNATGTTYEEQQRELKELREVISQVWVEAHQVLGFIVDGTPRLETAKDLLRRSEQIKKAIEELEQPQDPHAPPT